ncbi:MAG TPA: hypothetical protein VM093_07570 [Aeromicrobium sp.]|nr:hypothetical protein [Aeromicrobium sp.]
MSWFWTFESSKGEPVGQSETFDSRSDAETWIGEMFSDLLDDGVAQVRLFDGVKEAYGPMKLSPE